MKKENESNSIKNIKIAFYLNLIFSIIEIIGGYLTNSISIFSDSIHDFSDSITIGLSYFFEKKSYKNADDKYTYGYLRYSLLGAFISSLFLFIGSILIIYRAIPRIINPQIVNYDAMIIFAIFGILINGYAAYKTSNSHKHNEKSINLHMLEDVLGWIIILIGSLCIKIFNISIIDPILSVIIAIYILYHAYKNIKEILNIFMEKVPSNLDINKIKEFLITNFDKIKDVHHIHIWTIDGSKNYMTAHISLKKDLTQKEIIKLKQEIKNELNKNNINHITIEIEYLNEKCEDKNCKN